VKKQKEPRFPTPRKKELVEWMLRDLLIKEPWLTAVQCRRVFSYGYRLLYGKNFDKLYKKVKGEA
jgi:hypothetical protein